MMGANVLNENEIKEFIEWKKSQAQDEFTRVFAQLEDLSTNKTAKSYNATMPVSSFKIMARALLLLRDRVTGSS